MTFSGWIATIAGWYVTEIGRQPWLVYGVLLTRDAVAHLPPAHVGITLTAYLVTYVLLLGAFITTLFYLSRKEMHTAPRQPAASAP
jgi:cytochrome d ubiquinol oxidase subunit I